MEIVFSVIISYKPTLVIESARSHRDRDKDNQRENRHTVKEEYPELQYRSPLVRPGPSNRGTNVFVL